MDEDADGFPPHPHQLPQNNRLSGSTIVNNTPNQDVEVGDDARNNRGMPCRVRDSSRSVATSSLTPSVCIESTASSSGDIAAPNRETDNSPSTEALPATEGTTVNPNRARDALQRELRRRAEQIAAREALEELQRAEEASHPRRDKDVDRVSNREIHTRPHGVVNRVPNIKRAIILDSQWVHNFFPGSCSLRALFCVRCDIVNHWEMIREFETIEVSSAASQRHHPTPSAPPDTTVSVYYSGMLDGGLCERCWSVAGSGMPRRMLAIMIICDVITVGLPCGPFYHGCGTAMYGWWGRWMVRRKYRLKGYGWSDCLAALCCPGCMVEQERNEIAFNGQLYAAANNDIEMR